MVGTDILGLDPAQRAELLAFLRAEGSLLKNAGMSPALQQLVRDMNEDTWFSPEGSFKITGMFGGCRPGEPIADLVFVFMFGKVLKEVRDVLMNTENGWTLAYDESRFVEARAREHTAQENEEAYADDCVYFLRHEDPDKLLAAVRFTTEEFCKAARGTGSRSTSVWQRQKLWWSSGGGRVAETKLKMKSRGKTPHFKLLIRSSESWNNTSTWAQCARQVDRWVLRYRGGWTVHVSRILRWRGVSLPRRIFSLKCKRSVAATLLERRLFYSSETWPPLPMGHAKRLESVQMRWIRKAVKRYRGESCNKTDAQIRAEFSISTVESKIRHRRLGFLAQLRTASTMLRALLQEGGMRLPWIKAVVGGSVALQAAQPNQLGMSTHGLSWLWRTSRAGSNW